ncbi:MAG: DUF4827 domain-containing protein [Bacteroidaceae bacterium]
MKKLSLLFLSLLTVGLSLQSCDNYVTYAEQLKAEKEAIKKFISVNNIKVISTDQFYNQDSTTNVEKNEYVLFADNGIYMQIVEQGDERKAESNDEILARTLEVLIASGDTTVYTFPLTHDTFRYTSNSYQVLGQFIDYVRGGMYNAYGTQVPAGWLVPLSYVKLGSNVSTRAEVKLIVPSKMGQGDALEKVYPCFYRLTYQLPKN